MRWSRSVASIVVVVLTSGVAVASVAAASPEPSSAMLEPSPAPSTCVVVQTDPPCPTDTIYLTGQVVGAYDSVDWPKVQTQGSARAQMGITLTVEPLRVAIAGTGTVEGAYTGNCRFADSASDPISVGFQRPHHGRPLGLRPGAHGRSPAGGAPALDDRALRGCARPGQRRYLRACVRIRRGRIVVHRGPSLRGGGHQGRPGMAWRMPGGHGALVVGHRSHGDGPVTWLIPESAAGWSPSGRTGFTSHRRPAIVVAGWHDLLRLQGDGEGIGWAGRSFVSSAS